MLLLLQLELLLMMVLLLLHHHLLLLLKILRSYHMRLHLTLQTHALHIELLQLLLDKKAFVLQNCSLALEVGGIWDGKGQRVEGGVQGRHLISEWGGELRHVHWRHWGHDRDGEGEDGGRPHARHCKHRARILHHLQLERVLHRVEELHLLHLLMVKILGTIV